MEWPTEVTCHGDVGSGGVFHVSPIVWRPPEPEGRTYDGNERGLPGPYGYPFRTCSWDGSMHPEDLYNLLIAGATAHGSDWKYGWPHKFYIEDIPNPLAGKDVCDGSKSGGGLEKTEYTYGKGPATIMSKLYSEHISEITDSETFKGITELLYLHTNILFTHDTEGKLMYRAPKRGYQRA